MAYHELVYLILFLPATLLAYQLTPQRWRWMTLLAASYLFFWSISGKLLLILVGSSLFTHYIGVWLGYLRTQCDLLCTGRGRTEIVALRKKSPIVK